MLDSVLPFNCIEGCAQLAVNTYPEAVWNGMHISGMRLGPHVAMYETADKKYMCVSALEPKFFANLCAALDLPEWADGRMLGKDPALVETVFADKFKTKTRAEWIEVFADVDTCVEPVLDIVETWNHEQVLARGMNPLVPLSTAEGKSIKQIGNPVKLYETPVEYRHTAFPTGYHTEEILSEFGFTAEQIVEISS